MRRKTRQILIGKVAVGGGAPISVQTMTKTDTRNVAATVSQIHEMEMLGADIVRLAIPDAEAAVAFGEIRRQTKTALVADIHFDHTLALKALDAGADGLRINPGNIGGPEKLKEVVRAAVARRIPIRVGVNSGSLEADLEKQYGGSTAEALVESALRNVRSMEELGCHAIKISVKASDVMRTIDAYRLLSTRTDYPLHLGLTEAGTLLPGTIRSSVALGILLAEGIGDTIRVSLTDTPAAEVRVGLELLRCLGLRERGPEVVSCPTCGRVEVDVAVLACRIERRMEAYYREEPDAPRPLVAVMGCMVNGPGEARHADIAVAGGKGRFALYTKGEILATVDEADAEDAIMEQVWRWTGRGEKTPAR